jgi:fatty acid desaturase
MQKRAVASVSTGMATIASDTALCIKKIRATLPAEAFQPAVHRLWHLAIHAAVIGASYVVIRRWPAVGPLMAIVIGHSLACMAFVAHEISHNAVVRHRSAKYLLELALFGINGSPPTMWNRLHNDAHHGNANTVHDPDRPYLDSERTASTSTYAMLTMPAREGWRANVLVFAHFVTYLARHVVAVFYLADAKPDIVTSKPAYRPAERRIIAAEVAVMAAFQYGVWIATGRSWVNFLWASPAALVIASAVIMSYVFTNHFLNPISHDHDPLAGSTSVRVPRVFDLIHSNFSFHTEHHLFPSLNSDYYPVVSEALKEVAPAEYRQLGFGEAWRQLWRQPQFRELSGKNSARE